MRPSAEFLVESFHSWQRHRCSTLSAALAFFAMISIAPFLISLYHLAVFFVGHETTISMLIPKVRDRLGPKGAEFLEFLGGAFSSEIEQTGLMAIVDIVAMVWGAALYFRQLRDSLEVIWGYPDAPEGLILAFKQKVIGAVVAFLYSQIYLVSILVRIWFNIPSHAPETHLQFLLGTGDMFAFFLLQACLAALLYRFFAPKTVRGHALLLGVITTAALQALARLVGAYVLAHERLTSLTGIAGGFVVLVVWMNFMNQIFLYGAEVTHNWTIRNNSADA